MQCSNHIWMMLLFACSDIDILHHSITAMIYLDVPDLPVVSFNSLCCCCCCIFAVLDHHSTASLPWSVLACRACL
jgi:hypothetical protein